ncbi:LamG-like jellyroll fold domain-containing protein [Filomicrobium sp.]|uniref:LamG-like jellyroll fold domain-containing protein n=1 Tax=Filomicrobium sp. TaxID=2024831 RepID=UPI00258B0215|nr:LamG-like jellyroll fold domain-containing protein [Filomicrobium sp.]MCV0371707.1 LamG domain-containing protein [Filomicrobium sp.]
MNFLPGWFPAGAVMAVDDRISTTIAVSDILGWWDVDEGSGTTIGDKVSSPHDGTAAGTSWVTDGPAAIPNGLDFVPANNSWVDFGHNYDPPAGTVCSWVRIDNFSPDGVAGSIIGEGNGGGDFDLNTTSTSSIFGRTRIGGSDRTVTVAGLSTGQLYFMAYGWDTTDTVSEIELWVDGASVDANSGAWGSQALSSSNLTSGRRSSGVAQRELDGQVYQYLLFNRKLTLAEIQDLHNGGAGATFEMMQFA